MKGKVESNQFFKYMGSHKMLHSVSWILILVGALNWGLVGLGMLRGGMGWNVVNMLLGSWPMVESLVYVLVGLSAVYELFVHKKNCRLCGSGMSM